MPMLTSSSCIKNYHHGSTRRFSAQHLPPKLESELPLLSSSSPSLFPSRRSSISYCDEQLAFSRVVNRINVGAARSIDSESRMPGGEVQTMQASPVPSGAMTRSDLGVGPHLPSKKTDFLNNETSSPRKQSSVRKDNEVANKKETSNKSGSREYSVHVRVGSDVMNETMSTPPKPRMTSSGKNGVTQSSTVTPSSFAPSSPIEGSSNSNISSNGLHFAKDPSSASTAGGSPIRLSSASSNAGKSSPFPIQNSPPTGGNGSQGGGRTLPTQRTQFGGFVSRRGRGASGPKSRNMFASSASSSSSTGSPDNSPPAPFEFHNMPSTSSPTRSSPHVLAEQAGVESKPQHPKDQKSQALPDGGDSKTEEIDKGHASQPATESSSNMFAMEHDSKVDAAHAADDNEKDRPRSPSQSVCFAFGKESPEKKAGGQSQQESGKSDDENSDKKYFGGLFSAPNTPGNNDFKLDLKSPVAFSPFMNVDPNSPTFQGSKLTPIAAGRGVGSTPSAAFSLMKSPAANQRTPKGGMSSSGIDLRTPTTLGLLSGSFDTPNITKSLDTPTFSWLKSPPAGLLSSEVCATTPVSHFFKEVGGIDLNDTPKPKDEPVDESVASQDGSASDERTAERKRPLLPKKPQGSSAMQNTFSQICISPLASSKKGNHSGHTLAYMRSPKSPKRPGGYNSVKFSNSPLNVNMEKDLADDEDLSILLNLASSTTQGTVFRSPVVQQQHQHYQKLTARDAAKPSLQLPAISSSDTKTSPKLARKTVSDPKADASPAKSIASPAERSSTTPRPQAPTPSSIHPQYAARPPPQAYHPGHPHNTRRAHAGVKRRDIHGKVPHYPQPSMNTHHGAPIARGGAIAPYGRRPPPHRPGQSYQPHTHMHHPVMHPTAGYSSPPMPHKEISSPVKSTSKSNKRSSPKKKSASSPVKKPKITSPPVDAKEKEAAATQAVAKAGTTSSEAAKLAAAIMRGVTMRPSGKWQAQLYYAGKSRYIGVFDTREKAALAYEIARERLKTDCSETPNQSSETTEAKVNAARKAAFAGVNEPDPKSSPTSGGKKK